MNIVPRDRRRAPRPPQPRALERPDPRLCAPASTRWRWRSPLPVYGRRASERNPSRIGCYRHGIEVASGITEDPSFFFAWWGAPQEADCREESDLAEGRTPPTTTSSTPTTSQSAVVTHSRDRVQDQAAQPVGRSGPRAWLPAGAWDECATSSDHPRRHRRRARIRRLLQQRLHRAGRRDVPKNDEFPHIDVSSWEKPSEGDPDWTSPSSTSRRSFAKRAAAGRCVEIACDPARWHELIRSSTTRAPGVHLPADLGAEGARNPAVLRGRRERAAHPFRRSTPRTARRERRHEDRQSGLN